MKLVTYVDHEISAQDQLKFAMPHAEITNKSISVSPKRWTSTRRFTVERH